MSDSRNAARSATNLEIVEGERRECSIIVEGGVKGCVRGRVGACIRGSVEGRVMNAPSHHLIHAPRLISRQLLPVLFQHLLVKFPLF